LGWPIHPSSRGTERNGRKYFVCYNDNFYLRDNAFQTFTPHNPPPPHSIPPHVSSLNSPSLYLHSPISHGFHLSHFHIPPTFP
jgi:hypothetical protein